MSLKCSILRRVGSALVYAIPCENCEGHVSRKYVELKYNISVKKLCSLVKYSLTGDCLKLKHMFYV